MRFFSVKSWPELPQLQQHALCQGLEIPTWLAQHKPDVILLNIGTNDLIQGHSASSTKQDIINYEFSSASRCKCFGEIWCLLLDGYKIELVDINGGFFVDESNVTNCVTGTPGNPANMMMTRCQAHLPPNSPEPSSNK